MQHGMLETLNGQVESRGGRRHTGILPWTPTLSPWKARGRIEQGNDWELQNDGLLNRITIISSHSVCKPGVAPGEKVGETNGKANIQCGVAKITIVHP